MSSALRSELLDGDDPIKLAELLWSPDECSAYMKSELPFLVWLMGRSSYPIEWTQSEMALYGRAFTKAIKATKQGIETKYIEACGKILEFWLHELMSRTEDFIENRSHKKFSILQIIRSEPPSALVEARILLSATKDALAAVDVVWAGGLVEKFRRILFFNSWSSNDIKHTFAMRIAVLIDVVRKLGGDTEAHQRTRELLS